MRKMFDEEMIKKIASEAGSNYQAGNGISIENDTISVDETVALKEEIPTKTSDLVNDSDYVKNSELATVATTGDYDDLTNKPTIPTKTSDLVNDSGFGPALYKHRVWLAEGGVSGTNRSYGCRFDILLPVSTTFATYEDLITAAAAYYGNDAFTGASGDLRVTSTTSTAVPDISNGYPSSLAWNNSFMIANVGVNKTAKKMYLVITPGALCPVNTGTQWHLSIYTTGIPNDNITNNIPGSGKITFVLDVRNSDSPQFRDEVLGVL